MTRLALSAVGALLVALGLTALLARHGSAFGPVDTPGHRSLHDVARPRSGGLAVLAGVAAGLCLQFRLAMPLAPLGAAMAGLLAVAIVSLADDQWGVRPAARLVVHFGAAFLLVTSELVDTQFLAPLPAWAAVAVAVVGVVWLINLYNFMDGLDGFAGGMAVIGFGWLAVLAGPKAPPLLVLTVLTASAAAGFLLLNFPPARIFLGDVGAATLGYLAAVAVLWGASLDVVALPLGLVVFSPFISDATTTLITRIRRGEQFWLAHRGHYYQRLVLAGWGHRRTVLSEYTVMLLAGASAWLVQPLGMVAGWTLLLGWTLVYLALAWVLDRRLPARESA